MGFSPLRSVRLCPDSRRTSDHGCVLRRESRITNAHAGLRPYGRRIRGGERVFAAVKTAFAAGPLFVDPTFLVGRPGATSPCRRVPGERPMKSAPCRPYAVSCVAHDQRDLGFFFGVLDKPRDRHVERPREARDLAPSRVADAALDPGKICGMHPGLEGEVFDGESACAAQPSHRASQLGVAGHRSDRDQPQRVHAPRGS